MKITLIAPYPPPLGGISVHIKRMKHYLEKNNIKCEIYNESKWSDNENNIYSIKGYKKFIFKIPFIKSDVIHFHSIDKRVRILLGFYKLFGKKIILTIHGESLNDQIKKSNFITRFLLLRSLQKIDKIICVNLKTLGELVQLKFNPNKVIHLPAYCSPVEISKDKNRIPKYVWEFIKASSFLLSANGWIRFNKSEDLYGIDMLIDLVGMLKKHNIHVDLIIALLGVEQQSENEKEYYKKLKLRIKEYGIDNNILLFEVKDTEFYPILKESDLFLRPTNTDGDAVSIREALYYRIPTIASDVVIRPKEAVLFKTRDLDDLYNKTVYVIENYDEHKQKIKDIKFEDNAEKLLDIYKSLLEEQ